MQYRKFGNTGFEISALGFGAMRLPMAHVPPTAPEPDFEASIELICKGFEAGINYIDTAYFYNNHWSEFAVGRALKRNGWRKKIKLSTKLPIENMKVADDFWRILEEQLTKLNEDYIDFYHFHGIGERTLNGPIKDFKLFELTAKAKDRGLIKHLSFSFHDRPEVMKLLVDTGEFSSVLCQYNMLDVSNHDVISYAAEKGLGTVAMGPVGGGRLAHPGGVFQEAVKNKYPTPELALRFVLSHPAISCALSGMGNEKMLAENVRIASEPHPELSAADLSAIDEARKHCAELRKLYCTGCSYCRPECPQKIHIPAVLEALILRKVYGHKEHAQAYYDGIGGDPNDKKANICTKCGKCEPKCPQKLPIRQFLNEAVSFFEKK